MVVHVASYLPLLLHFTATITIPESKLMIPNITKPQATPPTIAAILDLLSEGTNFKGVHACVCLHNHDCN